MDRLENVATPLTAAMFAGSESVPPPGLAPMATVMIEVEPGTRLPSASCTATCTAGLIAAPAIALDGWTVKASLDAAAGLMVNTDEVAPVSAAEAAVRV